jgi:DDE_Tnp_1-associated
MIPERATPAHTISTDRILLAHRPARQPRPAAVADGEQHSLLVALAAVPDPRDPRGTRYPLVSMLAVAVRAVLAGACTFAAVADWARDLDRGGGCAVIARLSTGAAWVTGAPPTDPGAGAGARNSHHQRRQGDALSRTPSHLFRYVGDRETPLIGHAVPRSRYISARAQVIEDHPHNAENRMLRSAMAS